MAKSLKQVRLEEKMIEQIQAVADESFDGNFTAALIDCALSGVNMRLIPEHVRWEMKDGMRRTDDGMNFYNENGRIVVDALQI